MRIHLLAMVALLTAAVVTGCSSANEVSDATTHANAWGCDSCHGYPPPPFFPRGADTSLPSEMFPHAKVSGAMCWVCHPQTVLKDGHTINGALTVENAQGEPVIAHRDGQVEAVYGTPDALLPDAAACDSCHDAPPNTGRHAFHIQSRGVECGTCHKGFDPDARLANDAVHMQGLPYILVDDGSEAGAQITKAADAAGNWPDTECFTCHTALDVSTD